MYLIKFANKEPIFSAPISEVNNIILSYLSEHYSVEEKNALISQYFESYQISTTDEWGIENIVKVKRWDDFLEPFYDD